MFLKVCQLSVPEARGVSGAERDTAAPPPACEQMHFGLGEKGTKPERPGQSVAAPGEWQDRLLVGKEG